MNQLNIAVPLERTIGHSKLCICYGDLTTVAAEILVSSDDTHLTMGGGVSQALRLKAGEEVHRQARSQAPQPLGAVITTGAGSLAAKKLFHAIVLDRHHAEFTTMQLIREVVVKCLQRCDELQFHSIAFPALATGAARLSPEHCALAMIVEISSYLRKETHIKEVFIVLLPRKDRTDQIIERFHSWSLQFLDLVDALWALDQKQGPAQSGQALNVVRALEREILQPEPRLTAGGWATRDTTRDIKELAAEAAHSPGLKPQAARLQTAAEAIPERPIVITLHGIRTRGPWQNDINDLLQRAGFHSKRLDYGPFGVLKLLLPWTRNRKIEWFRDQYDKVTQNRPPWPSVVAHSFGTYILAKAVDKYNLQFEEVIFCGSIVSENYDWPTFINKGLVKRVLNDHGNMDIWSRMAPWVISDAGQAGLYPFKKTVDNRVINRTHSSFRHSDYFYEGNYKNGWLPFLKGETPQDPVNPTPAPLNWRFYLTMLIVVISIIGLIALTNGWIHL